MQCSCTLTSLHPSRAGTGTNAITSVTATGYVVLSTANAHPLMWDKELYVSGVSSEICSENAIRWLCGQVFASCVTVAGRPTPLPPCPSRCDEYANSCRSLHDLTNTEIVCPVSVRREVGSFFEHTRASSPAHP